MPSERCEHIASVRQNDEIIVMAGANSNGLTSELFRYNAFEDSWVVLHVLLPIPVISPTHISISDTNILILVGGMIKSDSESYEVSNCV
mmetsp:Transcript_35218/g.6334  ORF Transcript_35218/g.6334 Transcript_35218/m.6334 type:complete len:89 (-) Transcript_35218:181-447(-)